MGEFKFIDGRGVFIQKLLNQWRHQFKITPIETNITSEGYVFMLLWREPLNQKKENNDG